jgi:multidrug transporter EmrE-like cation transporter
MRRVRLPREHGAYVQLGVPLAAALACGRPGLAAIALALAAVALFLVHEPLLLLATRRGGRARETARAARRLERSLPGELILASMLAGAAVPVALAAAVPLPLAIWAWAAWSVGFGAVTCAVHGAVLRRARRDPRPARVTGLVLVIAAVVLVALRFTPAAAILPLIAAAIALHALTPSPRSVRRIGWTLATATLAAGAWMVIAVRLTGS